MIKEKIVTHINTQCCAFDENTRCLNPVLGHSNHCEIHYYPARKLYKTYKKICEIAYNLDIHKYYKNIEDNIIYVLECYAMYNKAYNARMAHRKYAFVPECYDDGHDYQFVFIKNKILESEKLLTQLQIQYQNAIKYKNNNFNILEQEETTIEDNINFDINIVSKTIIDSNIDRQTTEEDVNKIMDDYIKENKELMYKRYKIHELVIATLDNLVNNYIDKKYLYLYKIENNHFLIQVAIFRVCSKLYNKLYFTEDYKPDKCLCKTCNTYSAIQFEISCKCIYKYKLFNKYLFNNTELSIKQFYEILLLHHKKLIPIIHDIFQLFLLFEDELLFMNIELKWIPKLKRLQLSQSINVKEEKMSKYLARFRLKKKHLDKYIDNMSDDSD
jgi:hypothetical protein